MFSLASNLAASSGVSLSLPASAAGLWSGVIVRNVKVPWRSGFPSGVRGGCHSRDWAAAGARDQQGDGQDTAYGNEVSSVHRILQN